MRKWLKASTALVAASLMIVTNTVGVSACTGVYAGSNVTDDGSTYYGRSEDFGPSYNKIFTITEAATHEKDEMMVDDVYGGFSIPYPAETCRYSIMRDIPELWQDWYGCEYMAEPYAEAGVNEYGVSMSATVSTYDNDAVEECDPLVDTGVSETCLGTLILQSATTAREGVEIIAAVVEKYGAAECNAIFIADTNETWYLEIVSGHQYAAIKLDPTKVSVVPNMMMMDQIDITDENVIASADLIKIPRDNNFLVTEDPENPNSIHVAKTYSEGYPSHSSYRAWQGMYILNLELAATVKPEITLFVNDMEEDTDTPAVDDTDVPEEDDTDAPTTDDVDAPATDDADAPATDDADAPATDDVDDTTANTDAAEPEVESLLTASNPLPNASTDSAVGPFVLQFNPSTNLVGKINLKTMIAVLQARGEGSQYDTNVDPNVYPIGNEYQAEDHIFQVRQGLPAEIATIQWQAMGPAEFSIFVPYYTTAMTKTPDVYHNESFDYDEWVESGEDSMYWVFDEIAILANEHRDTVAGPVKEYFSDIQDKLIEQQKAVDTQMQALYASNPELATTAAEALANQVAEQVYEIAVATLDEINDYLENGGQLVLNKTMPTVEYTFPTELLPEDPGQTVNPGQDEKPSTTVDTNKANTTNTNNTTKTTTNAPKTGDNSNVVLWVALIVIAAAAICAYIVISRKKKK